MGPKLKTVHYTLLRQRSGDASYAGSPLPKNTEGQKNEPK